MHILATSSATLDDLIEPIDLDQTPAPMVVLSFSDSDLRGLQSVWEGEKTLPDLRIASLRDLRHPMSVDLWIEKLASHARIIVVRILGGYEWWRYGCDQLAQACRRHDVKLALLPGECRHDDERLASLSTLTSEARTELLECFREGGAANLRILLWRMASHAGVACPTDEIEILPRAGFYLPGQAVVTADQIAHHVDGRPCVPVLFYRSMLLAEDIAPIDALHRELAHQGIACVPIFVSSLREKHSADFLYSEIEGLAPKALITTTAFASGAEPGEGTIFDALDIATFQVVIATTKRQAWQEGSGGLVPVDLAMHVVLPELDGRIMGGAISFKEPAPDGSMAQLNRAEPLQIKQVAARIAAFLTLQSTPRAERKLTILLPDYPGSTGRAGYAVGLDVPASALAMLQDLAEAGYRVENIPASARDLMIALDRAEATLQRSTYQDWLSAQDCAVREQVQSAWGEPNTEFSFRAVQFGNVTAALAPDRGRSADRRGDYHDPTLPPCHELLAFGLYIREELGTQALIHLGAHGTLEWLPGKPVALTPNCFPQIMIGALPIIYPFIVSNPGEAAQAKRRINAVTLGHLTAPLIEAGLDPHQQELERLVDEYAQADGLDRRRRDRLASLIVEQAGKSGLSREAGVDELADPDTALMQIDAWLCDLKDTAVKDGLHIYGRQGPLDSDEARGACAKSEREALLVALDGRHIQPGPAGAPARGRSDVLPTGRNLYASDPRTFPTRTAFALAERAVEDVLRTYLQDHGDWPRALVIDLWGSASLRTGGEEVAQGLILMGCRPQWDNATGRVTGIEVLPPAAIGRPRVDVTWRISGLFRDMFASQIMLLDAALRAVAARDEDGADNPLAAEYAKIGPFPSRIFGSAPGTYGTGVETQLASGDWTEREELGQTYLDTASHSFSGPEGAGQHEPEGFAAQLRHADLLLHNSDDPGHDLLEGSADVAFIGGFAAAIKALGGKADLIILDTTKPEVPRARSLAQSITRVVRARALNRRFIEGQMRHGPRGASEFAETVDRLIGFVETTDAVAPKLIDDLYDAYLGDDEIRGFLLDQNPEAAGFIAERFASARRRNLWHPLRNSIDHDLAALIEEAKTRRQHS